MARMIPIEPGEKIRFDFGVARATLRVEAVHRRLNSTWCLVEVKNHRLAMIYYCEGSPSCPNTWVVLSITDSYPGNDAIRNKFKELINGGVLF